MSTRSVSPGRELERVHRAAGVDEAEAVAFEPLHDEAFAAEQADAELLLERDADRHAARRAEERVLLADQLAAERVEIHREDLARVRRGERDPLLAGAAALVNTVMNRLSPVSRRLPAPSSAPMTPAARLLAAVAEDGLHLDAVVMYIIAPASATALSPGSSSTSTNCMSSPKILKSISCARRPAALPSGGGARRARGLRETRRTAARP